MLDRVGGGTAANQPDAPPRREGSAWGPFSAIFITITAFGAVVALLIARQTPVRERLLAAGSPAVVNADSANANLPPDHPPVRLSKEIRAFIEETEAHAQAHPHDRAAWIRLGDVTLRAAAFDASYYLTAAQAYSHVLKADPDNLEALRGVGNIDFDQGKFDPAIAAYEHYLGLKADDPEVRTDLGTMLLSSGAADQAVGQYQRVLESHPRFFEAAFNLGVAYDQSGRPADARAALARASKLAPDDRARARVDQMLASLAGTDGSARPALGLDAPGLPAAVKAAAPASFHGAIEQMLRALPIAGAKVQAVRWDSAANARALMDDFPMDQMPPFAAAKFIADLKAGIDHQKGAFKISTPVRIDLCDAASGRVMRSITE